MKPIWKGWLSFGLVHIPVNLYSGTKAKELSFHFVHRKDHSPIHYARICDKEGKEVHWEEVVRGYRLKRGDMVVLTEEDFEKANQERVKSIEIVQFASLSEISPSYFEKPYLLEPQRGAGKAYALLCEALFRSKKVGICKFVLRNREHLGAIIADEKMIILNQMRFSHELIERPSLKIPKGEKISKKEVGVALQFIEHLTAAFKPKRYKDEYREELLSLIEKKAKGRTIRKKGKLPKKTKRVDFLKVLQKSLKKKAA